MELNLCWMIFSFLPFMVEAFQVLYDQKTSGTSALAQHYGLSLPSCVRKCRCFSGCISINFYTKVQLCELFDVPASSSDIQISPGCIALDLTTLSTASCVFTENCIIDRTIVCPEPEVELENGVVLGNTVRAGQIRRILCSRCSTLEGPPGSVCTRDGGWTEFGSCFLPISTMRQECATNCDCVDANSHCRDGKCWCLPRHSFNAASRTCVVLCPGGYYGDTFQELPGRFIAGTNIAFFSGVDMDECKAACLGYTSTSSPTYTCKYVDYVSINANGNSRCNLNTIPDTEGPTLTVGQSSTIFLQRDCTVPEE